MSETPEASQVSDMSETGGDLPHPEVSGICDISEAAHDQPVPEAAQGQDQAFQGQADSPPPSARYDDDNAVCDTEAGVTMGSSSRTNEYTFHRAPSVNSRTKDDTSGKVKDDVVFPMIVDDQPQTPVGEKHGVHDPYITGQTSIMAETERYDSEGAGLMTEQTSINNITSNGEAGVTKKTSLSVEDKGRVTVQVRDGVSLHISHQLAQRLHRFQHQRDARLFKGGDSQRDARLFTGGESRPGGDSLTRKQSVQSGDSLTQEVTHASSTDSVTQWLRGVPFRRSKRGSQRSRRHHSDLSHHSQGHTPRNEGGVRKVRRWTHTGTYWMKADVKDEGDSTPVRGAPGIDDLQVTQVPVIQVRGSTHITDNLQVRNAANYDL